MGASRRSRVAVALALTGLAAVAGGTTSYRVTADTKGTAGTAGTAGAAGAAARPRTSATRSTVEHPSLSAALGGGRGLIPEVRRPGEHAQGDPRAAGVARLEPQVLAAARARALAQTQAMPAVAPPTGARWVDRGPTPIDYGGDYAYSFTGWGRSSGRVVALAVDPRDKSGDTVYAGTSGGGLWRSADAGRTWTARFQDQASMTVGAVVVEPGTGTVHVGTGEPNYNVSGDPGTGIYRSTDDGRTWRRATGVPTGTQVHRIALGRPGTLFAATSRGLYVSTDGGASYVDVELPTDRAGTAPYTESPYGSVVTDVVVKPDDPDQITAVVGWWLGQRRVAGKQIPQSVGNGLYRSTEGGLRGTWSRMDSPTFGRATTSTDPIGRVTLAYATGEGQDHDVMWALIQDAGQLSGKLPVLDQWLVSPSVSYLNGIYRSGDDGATWELKGEPGTLSHAEGSVYANGVLVASRHVGAQAWYNQYLAVDPTDENRVILGLEEIYATQGDPATPGLASWQTIGRFWSTCRFVVAVCSPSPDVEEGAITPHPDHHSVAVVATPDGARIYDGSDGGVAVLDEVDGRFDNDAWQMRNDGIGTAKPYYAVMGRDGQILTGMQDNGTALVAPGSTYGVAVYGADGGGVAIDPVEPDIMYAETQLAGFRITVDGGVTWTYAPPPDGQYSFITPFSLDDADRSHLLIGGEVVYASAQGDATTSADWVPVFELAPDAATDAVSYVRLVTATDLTAGAAYVTWCYRCDVPFSTPAQARSGLATNVKPDCERVVAGAECWHHATGAGLPARLLTDVAIDRRDPRVVVVSAGGYEYRWYDGPSTPERGHVFLSRDAGESFVDISRGLPDVPVNSVVLRGDEVYAGTDVGVFRAARPGAPFQRLGAGLPAGPVFDLTLNPQRTTLVAATHGRGVWTLSLGAARGARPSTPGAAPVRPRPLPATGPDGRSWLAGLALLAAAAVVHRGTVRRFRH